MRDETPGQRKARLAIRAQATAWGWNDPDFAREVNVHRDTARRLMAGDIWPQRETRDKIEKRFGWDADTIMRIADGLIEPPSIKPSETEEERDARRVARLPDDVTEEETAELLDYLAFIRRRRNLE